MTDFTVLCLYLIISVHPSGCERIINALKWMNRLLHYIAQPRLTGREGASHARTREFRSIPSNVHFFVFFFFHFAWLRAQRYERNE